MNVILLWSSLWLWATDYVKALNWEKGVRALMIFTFCLLWAHLTKLTNSSTQSRSTSIHVKWPYQRETWTHTKKMANEP